MHKEKPMQDKCIKEKEILNMARKSTIEKLKTRISVLEKDRQRKVDEQIELILKTDPEILQINSQIDDLRKMVKASEELERKKVELEKQMLDLLD